MSSEPTRPARTDHYGLSPGPVDGSRVMPAGGCDAIVHAGAIAHDRAGTPEEIVATNVLGTWHVLASAEQHGVAGVVYFSSAQVFGFADGEGTPTRLPVDDGQPLHAARPYGMSKRLAEQMCEIWSDRTGFTTIVLRPVLILDDHGLEGITADEVEYGAFVHIDDVAAAALHTLTTDLDGHMRMTLCGPGPVDTDRAERGVLTGEMIPTPFASGSIGRSTGPDVVIPASSGLGAYR